MTRGSAPTIHCDGGDGDCVEWSIDHYTALVHSIGGVRITADAPAAGWRHIDGDDFCPDCAPGVKR